MKDTFDFSQTGDGGKGWKTAALSAQGDSETPVGSCPQLRSMFPSARKGLRACASEQVRLASLGIKVEKPQRRFLHVELDLFLMSKV